LKLFIGGSVMIEDRRHGFGVFFPPPPDNACIASGMETGGGKQGWCSAKELFFQFFVK
jgi:hypothetical protein